MPSMLGLEKSVLLNLGWLDGDWTQNPISVQCLSKPCPMSVQSQKKYKVCPIKYRICPKSVEYLSNSETLGQRLDIEIQHLSRHCPMKNYQERQFHNLCPIFVQVQCLSTLCRKYETAPPDNFSLSDQLNSSKLNMEN